MEIIGDILVLPQFPMRVSEKPNPGDVLLVERLTKGRFNHHLPSVPQGDRDINSVPFIVEKRVPLSKVNANTIMETESVQQCVPNR